MNKFLIVGLGNKGDQYKMTRHNIGFEIVDHMASQAQTSFETTRFGWMAKVKNKNTLFVLLKPDTYMNLSGNAVKFWMQKEKIAPENLLIITDDLNLKFGTFRIKTKGSDGGHNGLKSIQNELQTTHYSRFRFGIGNRYEQGQQIDFVLSRWSEEEYQELKGYLEKASKAVFSFGLQGIALTMNQFNGTDN